MLCNFYDATMKLNIVVFFIVILSPHGMSDLLLTFIILPLARASDVWWCGSKKFVWIFYFRDEIKINQWMWNLYIKICNEYLFFMHHENPTRLNMKQHKICWFSLILNIDIRNSYYRQFYSCTFAELIFIYK